MDRRFSWWEGDSDKALSQREAVTVRERARRQLLTVQEISRRGARRSRELYQWQEEHVSSQELCQWRKDISTKIWDRALRPLSEEKPQPCHQVGPSSPSPEGTAVAAEAVPALPSASPAPQSPMEAELAAAALAGADEKEEPHKTLALEEKKAAAPLFREELPSPGTQSSSSAPSDTRTSSQASLCQDQNITEEILIQELTKIYKLMEKLEGEYALQQQMAAEETQPSSPSPIGMEVAAKAVPALPSASSVTGSPAVAKAEAAAPAGREKEELPKPLTPEELKGTVPSLFSAELPSPGTQSSSSVPSDTRTSSQASLCQDEVTKEILIQGLTDIYELMEKLEEEYALQQQMGMEETQPSSPSPEGTPVAAEAVLALPSASPAPQNPTEAKPAAAAPDGADEKEELPKALTPEEVKAATPSLFSDELSSPGTQTPPSVCSDTLTSSRASPCQDQSITEGFLIQGVMVFFILRQNLDREYALQQQMAVEETQPSSPSPVGTAVAAEAVPALPSASPAPQSPTDQNINREILSQVLQEIQTLKQQMADLQQGLAVKESVATAKREESLVPALQSTSPAPQSTSPAPQSPMEQNINKEILSQVLQEIHELKQQQEEVYALQQWLAVEVESVVTAKREESSVPALHSPPSPWPGQLGSQCPREQQEEAAVGSVQAVGEKMGDCDEEMKWWQFLDELEPFLVRDPELSQVSVTEYTGRISWQEAIAELAPCEASAERLAQEPCSQGPVPAPHSPPSPWPAQLRAQAPGKQQQEGAASAPLWAVQESQEGTLAGEDKKWEEDIEPELSQWENKEEAEVSHGEMSDSQEVSQGEECPEQELSQEELSDWQEQREEEVSQGEECPEQELSQEELSDWEEQREEEVSQGEECPEQELSQEEFSDWEEYTEEDVSQGEDTSHHEHSDWDKYFPEQELSQGEVSGSQNLSDWEEYAGQGLIGGDVSSWSEHSDREESIGQDPSQREACVGQDTSRGNGSRPSGLSSSEDDSCEELMQEICEDESDHGIWTKPSFFPEEEEWDEVSILELLPEDNRDQNWRVFAAVPIPREAWVEEEAPEPHSPGPLRALLMPLKRQAPVGRVASLPSRKPEAGRESRVPAPHSAPSPWPARLGAQPHHGQPAPLRQRPSRFSRALPGLFLCPCMRPQPEE